MKNNARKQPEPDMLPEYDFSKSVRNKYYGILTPDTPIRLIGTPERKPAKPANGRRGLAAKKRASKK